jgi:AcrR family transcriptional regulator
MSNRAILGRPPKITLEKIIESALRIGLEQMTIRKVADDLGISVPGLYHYVRTREELVDLVVEASFSKLADDAMNATSFEGVLLKIARGLFDLISQHPSVASSIAAGNSIITSKVAGQLDRLIAMGAEDGLEPSVSYVILVRLASCVVGAAVIDSGERAMRHGVGSFLTQFREVSSNQADPSPLSTAIENGLRGAPFDHFKTVEIILDRLLRDSDIERF